MISESQLAYIEGRNILDGPLIINEVCSWAKKTKIDLQIMNLLLFIQPKIDLQIMNLLLFVSEAQKLNPVTVHLLFKVQAQYTI